jgi:hypothetical protein
MKAMACCSPLSEVATTNVAEAENLDTMDYPIEMAHIVGGGEILGVSDDVGRALSAGATEDFVDRGASDGENSQMYYFVRPPSPLAKSRKWPKRDILHRAKPERLGWKQFWSPTLMKLSCMRTFSSLVCICLCILLWLIFYYTFSHSCIS